MPVLELVELNVWVVEGDTAIPVGNVGRVTARVLVPASAVTGFRTSCTVPGPVTVLQVSVTAGVSVFSRLAACMVPVQMASTSSATKIVERRILNGGWCMIFLVLENV